MGTATSERPRYTERQKAEALAVLDTGVSLRTAEDITGVPNDTLCRWRQGLGVNDDVLESLSDKNAELASSFERIAERCIAAITDEKLDDAPLSQIATAAGIAVDKMRLLRGEASPDGALSAAVRLRALDELKRMMSERQSPTSPLPVSGTTDVVIDAVSTDHDALISLGTCQICGDNDATKTTKGGARVCSGCIPD